MTAKIFIVDSMSLVFRSYHAFIKRPLTTSHGQPVSAVYGVAMFLMKLIETEKPDYLVIATDSSEKNFRHALYPAYKANRKEMPSELKAQLPWIEELYKSLGCQVLKQSGMEADDLIGSFVKCHGNQEHACYIVSGDKDFMQLISDRVSLYVPQKGEDAKIVGAAGVFEKFGCAPDKVIDVLALMGDSSDNVPGVKGVGEKGASKLIQDFGSVENLLEHAEEIPNAKVRNAVMENREMALLSKKLVTIHTDIDIEMDLEAFKVSSVALTSQALYRFFERCEFRTLMSRLEILQNPELKLTKPANVAQAREIASHHEHYLLVNSPERFRIFQEEISAVEKFAFDTETTGLNVTQDQPIGFSFATSEGRAFFVPYLEKHLEQGLQREVIYAFLKELFAKESQKKIAHNLKYDLQMLRNLGIEVRGPLGDTMLMAFLIDSTDRFGLDEVSRRYLGIQKIPTTDLMGPKKKTPMSEVPLDLLSVYACEDADCVLRLDICLQPELDHLGLAQVYERLEVPIADILGRMEQEGIGLDTFALKQMSETLLVLQTDLEKEICELAGETFNVNSPKQLQVILYDKLKIHEQAGLTRLKKTKSGFSTDVSVLEMFVGIPIAEKILEYRAITKLKNTYLDALPLQVNSDTNRVHTSFHQTGTATGRLSSNNPNLQNIPIRTPMGREVRRAFIAKSGCKIISADYSQIELRILAHLAEDETLIQAFLSGEDIHTLTAATVFEKPLSSVTKEERSQAKAINYGIVYGMGANRLAQETGLSIRDAKDFIDRYFARFSRIKGFIEESVNFAESQGFCRTLMNRIRPIVGLNGKDRMLASQARNIAINTPIQGSAADLIKIAMIHIDEALKEKGLKTKLLLQVHDELVFESPDDEVDMVSSLIRDKMSNAIKLKVPIEVSLDVGQNWLDAH